MGVGGGLATQQNHSCLNILVLSLSGRQNRLLFLPLSSSPWSTGVSPNCWVSAEFPCASVLQHQTNAADHLVNCYQVSSLNMTNIATYRPSLNLLEEFDLIFDIVQHSRVVLLRCFVLDHLTSQ